MNYCPNCGAKLENMEDDRCPACGCAFEEIKDKLDETAKRKNALHSLRQRFTFSKTDEPAPGPSPVEDGYDGYYEDVQSADEGHDREGIAPELVRKIAVLAVGALLIIAACVAMMYLI